MKRHEDAQKREDISVDHAEDVERMADTLAELRDLTCAAVSAPTLELSRASAHAALKLVCRTIDEWREGRESWVLPEEDEA